MTNKDPKRLNPPRVNLEELVEAREALVRKGLVADSGRRKFCKQTGRYEIMWGIAPGARFVCAYRDAAKVFETHSMQSRRKP
jgi:hypothetical protein